MKHPKSLQKWMKELLINLGVAEKEDIDNWHYIKNQPDKLTVYCWYKQEIREIDLKGVRVG